VTLPGQYVKLGPFRKNMLPLLRKIADLLSKTHSRPLSFARILIVKSRGLKKIYTVERNNLGAYINSAKPIPRVFFTFLYIGLQSFKF
jgi:hypothetical protein